MKSEIWGSWTRSLCGNAVASLVWYKKDEWVSHIIHTKQLMLEGSIVESPFAGDFWAIYEMIEGQKFSQQKADEIIEEIRDLNKGISRYTEKIRKEKEKKKRGKRKK